MQHCYWGKLFIGDHEIVVLSFFKVRIKRQDLQVLNVFSEIFNLHFALETNQHLYLRVI